MNVQRSCDDQGSIHQNDGECHCWTGSLGIVQCYKWGQARLCTGPHALLHIPISNARQGYSETWGRRLHTVQTKR